MNDINPEQFMQLIRGVTVIPLSITVLVLLIQGTYSHGPGDLPILVKYFFQDTILANTQEARKHNYPGKRSPIPSDASGTIKNYEDKKT